MTNIAKLSALIALSYCVCGPVTSGAADEDQSFARVINCQNDVGRAEVYLPGSAMTDTGKPELRLGDKTVNGYLAFDFTPIGKNKTLNAASIRLGDNGRTLTIELKESGLSATIQNGA